MMVAAVTTLQSVLLEFSGVCCPLPALLPLHFHSHAILLHLYMHNYACTWRFFLSKRLLCSLHGEPKDYKKAFS